MLGHVGALDEGLGAGALADHALHLGLWLVEVVVLALALPTVLRLALGHHGDLLADGLEGLTVELDAPHGLVARAAPIEVHATIIVLEEIGVPELHGRGDRLEGLVQGVDAREERAALPALARAEHYLAIDEAHVGGIILVRKLRRGPELP